MTKKLKIKIVVRKNDYDFEMLCCGKPMKCKSKEFTCSEHRDSKCEVCGRRIKYERFFQEARNPTKEEREKYGYTKEPQEHTFRFEEM